MAFSFTATMEHVLTVLQGENGSRPWLTALEINAAYRKRAPVAVQRRTIFRNLNVMLNLGFIRADSPPRSQDRRYRITDAGASARATFKYGDTIGVDSIAHDHSFGNSCARCRLEESAKDGYAVGSASAE